MKSIRSRSIVVISGLPGTGKTTIAEPLAAALGYVFIAKDDIEETLYDALMAKPMISFVRGSTQSVIFLHFCTAVNSGAPAAACGWLEGGSHEL